MVDVFDVAVIGRGMIGAAASRHLAESGMRTVVIGRDDTGDHQGPGPFSSHWDEGRITRIAARDRMWAVAAKRAIGRYADIERRSGVSFHHPCDVAIAFANAEEWASHSRDIGGDAVVVTAADFLEATGIHVPAGFPVSVEGPPAGFVRPLRLVAAETKLAELAGATVVRDVVDAIDGTIGAFTISGGWGSVTARHIVVATGAFSSELLGRRGIALDLRPTPRTVVLAEFAEPDEATGDTGKPLPCLILDAPSDPRLDEIYWVPPVRYPNGRRYLKIGGDMQPLPPSDPESVMEWFRAGGSPDEIDALQNTVIELLPGRKVIGWDSRPCVVTNTATEHPYIGWVEGGIAVAIGGNGSSAKSSDELGRLVARLVVDGEWSDPELDASEFTPVTLP